MHEKPSMDDRKSRKVQMDERGRLVLQLRPQVTRSIAGAIPASTHFKEVDMDENIKDIFLIGLIGGFIGAAALVASVYFHLQSMYRRYWLSRDAVHSAVSINKLESKMDKLEIQMKALHGEFYHRETEEEYR